MLQQISSKAEATDQIDFTYLVQVKSSRFNRNESSRAKTQGFFIIVTKSIICHRIHILLLF